MADDALFTIAGQEFKVTSPERVFYPSTGTTKLDVIGYYAEASTAMLPHLVGAAGDP
jgi:bifunctional non-homologous end joining protein LigD